MKGDLTLEELHARRVAELEQDKAGHLRQAKLLRTKQAEAKAGGDLEIARKLGMLAAHHEQAAALAEAEKRDRTAKLEKFLRLEKNRQLASRERPGRRPALRTVIAETLAPLKREGITYKDLMRRWERERIGSLRLDDLGDGRYRVTDEDGDEGAAKDYTARYLEKLYSLAR